MSGGWAIFLKLAGWLFKPFKKALAWLFSDARHAMIGLLLFVTAHDRWKTIPALRAEIIDLTDQAKALGGTVDNLRAAARRAEIRQQANLVRVDAAHGAINRENVSALSAELAALRRRAELLSANPSGRMLGAGSTATHSGSANATGVSGTVPARAGTVEATGDQGLSGTAGGGATGAGDAALTIHERLVASEQAHQLDRLIDAVLAAAGMDLSPEQAPADD